MVITDSPKFSTILTPREGFVGSFHEQAYLGLYARLLFCPDSVGEMI